MPEQRVDGEEGDITYPIPVYVIERPTGLVVVDTGFHPELATSTDRVKKLVPMFQVHLPADGSGSVGRVLGPAGFGPAQ